MKINILALFLFISVSNVYSQVGLSISYGIDKNFSADCFYINNDNRFHLGFSNQLNGQKATVVRQRLANYGTTYIEEGNFFWLLDFGYSRIIRDRFSVHSELSIGQRHRFTSYEDNRFRDNGYSLINNSKTIVGIGVNVGYLINENFEFFAGYHTTKQVTLGIRMFV